MRNNPYIDIIKTDEKILQDLPSVYAQKWKWNDFFQNTQENYLEIGTGLWNFFALESSQNLDKNFIGMEIKFKRLYKTAQKARNLGTKDFVVIKDFAQNISKIFASGEVAKTYIFFPDPWDNKDRQKKHKLMQMGFLDDLYEITKNWGRVCFKTDHRKYFEETLELIQAQNKFRIEKLSYDYENEMEIFDKKKLTEFETMYRSEQVQINYVELVK